MMEYYNILNNIKIVKTLENKLNHNIIKNWSSNWKIIIKSKNCFKSIIKNFD